MEYVVGVAAAVAALGLCLRQGSLGIRVLAAIYVIGAARLATYDQWVFEFTDQRLIIEIIGAIYWGFPALMWRGSSGEVVVVSNVAPGLLVLVSVMFVILGMRVTRIAVSLHRARASGSSGAES